jgi:hypothetical protein
MRIRGILLVGGLIFFCADTASAQDASRVGITMGYPASIGLLWHVSDRVALRPEFSFTLSDSSSESIVNAESNFWSLGTGVSMLFYSPLTDNLRAFIAPRFSYTRTSGDTDVTESTTDIYSVAGMFGAQYSLARRFGVFGEVGFSYAHQTGMITSKLAQIPVSTSSHGDTIGTRTGVGVVLYF